MFEGGIIMSINEVAKICPLCGQDNNCKHGEGGCWCDTVEFPKYILELIPSDKRGKACICKSCLEKYQK